MPRTKAPRVNLTEIDATAHELREQVAIRAKADPELEAILRSYWSALSIAHEKYLVALRGVMQKQLKQERRKTA